MTKNLLLTGLNVPVKRLEQLQFCNHHTTAKLAHFTLLHTT